MQVPVALGVVFAATSLILAPSKPGEAPQKPPEPGVYVLTQEIGALRTIYRLRLTQPQMEAMLKLAPETMAKEREVKKGKVSDDYRALLGELSKALVEAEDDERIGDLEEKVSDLQESETPEIDDSYTVTQSARERVPEVYKRLKPAQVAAYFASLPTEEILDPADELVAALEGVRELKPDAWKESREELADELSWLVAGLNRTKAEKVHDEAAALIGKARELSDEQFKEKRPELEKKARKLIGDIDPSEVLRHHLQRTLADLLANPRLELALKARLEPEK